MLDLVEIQGGLEDAKDDISGSFDIESLRKFAVCSVTRYAISVNVFHIGLVPFYSLVCKD